MTLSATLQGGSMDASGAGNCTISLLWATIAQSELDLNPQIWGKIFASKSKHHIHSPFSEWSGLTLSRFWLPESAELCNASLSSSLHSISAFHRHLLPLKSNTTQFVQYNWKQAANKSSPAPESCIIFYQTSATLQHATALKRIFHSLGVPSV